MRKYGHLSGAKWDVLAETYSDNPRIVLDIVRSYLKGSSIDPKLLGRLPSATGKC